MAQITITIPDEKVSEVLEAFAYRYKYDSESGETKAQFAKRKLIDFIKREYREYKADQAARSVVNDLDDLS